MCTQELIEKLDKLVNQQEGCCELDVSVEILSLTRDVISRAAFGSNFGEGRFMPTKVNKRMRQIYGEVRGLLQGITEKREKSIQMENDEKDDLLSLLSKSNMKELQKKQDSNAGMTIEDVIEECKLFYFAGQETTANLLTWSMITLSMHQNWQERAREEVLKFFGKNKPTSDDLNHLKIVNMILLEVLRLYPPTSLIKRTTKKTKLGDFYLPT
ncbi:hypothetical protein LWI29_015312 [Acer saccharum]|uniref:Uncharacterized protein n=1 Tax=Acer saccharum TaxID=4024 RepID=A0AA39SI33_ACESA|nr:hypothetical protein LWI29_015312 [Acer saccharum]